jgi:hypothetical protein
MGWLLFNKERVQDLNTLTEDNIKRYLKKLNLNDYYDNVIGIIDRINGRPPFTLTSEVEDKIKIMFQQIQDPYDKFKPAGRKISYRIVIHFTNSSKYLDYTNLQSTFHYLKVLTNYVNNTIFLRK